jgi:hypothetical protein
MSPAMGTKDSPLRGLGPLARGWNAGLEPAPRGTSPRPGGSASAAVASLRGGRREQRAPFADADLAADVAGDPTVGPT